MHAKTLAKLIPRQLKVHSPKLLGHNLVHFERVSFKELMAFHVKSEVFASGQTVFMY